MEHIYVSWFVFTFVTCTYTFLGFSGKTSSSIFVCSHAHKSIRMQLSRILSLFRTHKGYMKKEPPGVPFNLFSDSLNMKIFPSNLVLFTLVKVFEENIWQAVNYHFFGLFRLIYEKGPCGVFFKCFSYSLNMKNP
jgi:hypothetical protein